MSAEVKFYGELIDITGSDSLIMTADSVNELRDSLFQKFPALQSKTFLIAIGNKIVSENSKIADGDQIALLPPFAGG